MMLLACTSLFAQEHIADSLSNQTDVREVLGRIFSNKSAKKVTIKHPSTTSILPSAGYSPSFGLAVGVTSTGGTTFGNPKTTNFSVYNWNAYVSTGGLASFELKHNTYTPNNRLNLLGSFQVGRKVAFDYGVGTGVKNQSDGNFSLNNIPFENNPDVFQMRYTYFKLTERLYRRLFDHVYAGAGFSANWYGGIRNGTKNDSVTRTHNYRYSMINKFRANNYMANGFLFNIEYDSRDHPNRPYEGLYADVVLRTNQEWLGSSHNAVQLKTELRKYWSLSAKNPEHLLAFWLWGNYLLSGSIPYFELPGTGSDMAERTGRAYTIGRFKGLSFFYSEGEYRFPLLDNKLLSGVVFANVETASNQRSSKLFRYWEPGAGVGLRLLFNKYSRSNLCIDYGRGNYGSSGIFLGLNEAF